MALLAVVVPVMDVRVMFVSVMDRIVVMRMGVRLTGRIVGAVFVLMVFVMNVQMLVIKGFMSVPMLVSFCEMKP